MLRRTSALFKAVSFKFVKYDGTLIKAVSSPVGVNLLEVAHRSGIDIEGACGGQCACATCHVILPHDLYSKCPEPNDEENDMLDLAADVESSSRLGCQVKVSHEFEGVEVKLPKSVVSQLL
jgi:ferredoxin